jgi:hypothetical protein
MIYIQKNQLNKIVLTLCETSRLVNPYYLFEITNEFNLQSAPIYFATPNISTNKNRYDLFNLLESPAGSTTGGYNVPLSLVSGQYKYNIYESSAATINIAATTGIILESGRMVVAGDIDSTITLGNPNSIYI